MTSKFKVGDKVVPVSKSFGDSFDKCKHAKKLKANEVNFLYVVGFRGEFILLNSDKTSFNAGSFYKEEDLKKFISKNQRITALEETVALQEVKIVDLRNDYRYEVEQQQKEINELKLIVEKIRKPSTAVEEALTAASSAEDVPSVKKSPNELRAEMIEKAKMFIEKSKNSNGYYSVYDNNDGISFPQIPFHCKIEFIVNEEKRTVIALMRGFQSNRVLAKGIAKCIPGDVFNKYIGMAIALGRALGLDVSEFEQAVQPTKLVAGMIYTNRIINDTDAIYGGGE